jgi:hypothetical protein
MERRNRFRWAYVAARIVANWARYLKALWVCPRITYATPETEDRAIRIGAACPHCICEKLSVGRHGSPGNVNPTETLYSVLIAPGDLQKDQIAITVMTHAERKGMSVMRQSAPDDEFKRLIATRIKNPQKQRFHGVVPVVCGDVRSIVAIEDGDQRLKGDRFYCVLDTDMDGLPNHADVFATLPRAHATKAPKVAWRKEREKLMGFLLRDFSSAQEFRNGALFDETTGPVRPSI